MAIEQGYDQQIMPQAPAGRPLANPEVYGAGVGQALAQAGAQLHGDQVRAYQIEKKLQADQELSAKSKALAEYSTRVDGDIAKMELEYAPGHPARVDSTLQGDDREALLSGITSTAVRQQIEGQLSDIDNSMRKRAVRFDLVKRAELSQSNAGDMRATLNNSIVTSSDPLAALERANKQWGTFAGGLELIDDATRGKLGREGEAEFTTSALATLAVSDPDKAEGLVKTGAFNDRLDERQMGHVLQAIDLGKQARVAAQHEADNAAARAQAQAQKKAKDDLEALKVGLDHGDVPAIKDISTAIANAREVGLPEADIKTYAYLAETAVQTKTFSEQALPDLQVQALSARQALGAGKLDPAGRRRLDVLDKEIERRAKDTGALLGSLWKSGADGERQAVAQLRALPKSQRAGVAGDLPVGALILSGLNPMTAETARVGAGIRKARGNEFMPKNDKGVGDEDLAKAKFNALLGQGVLNSLGGSADAVFGAVMDFYVGSQAQAGGHTGWSDPTFLSAMHIVFGATKRADGTDQGGLGFVRGRVIQLPDGWTGREFDQSISRFDFAAHGAKYRDGRAVDNADVRTNFHIVLDDESDDGMVYYRFEDDRGRALLNKDREPYRLPVNQRREGR